MNTDYMKDIRHAQLDLARGYHDMSFIFRHYVRNQPAARRALLISWVYSLGFNGLAQVLHNSLLRPVVQTHEWQLLTAYGKKYGII
jgi:hypothetical protein